MSAQIFSSLFLNDTLEIFPQLLGVHLVDVLVRQRVCGLHIQQFGIVPEP